ncbi:hypothetical protein N499_0323A, partial [Wolbachia pipientis wVitA]
MLYKRISACVGKN